jgi:hypothetical protein
LLLFYLEINSRFSAAIENTLAKKLITEGNFAETIVLFCFLLEEEVFSEKYKFSVRTFFSALTDLFYSNLYFFH